MYAHRAATPAPMAGLPDPERDRQFYDGVPARRLVAWFVDVAVILVVGVPLAVALRARHPRLRLRALPADPGRRRASSTAPRPSPPARRPGACG